MAGGRVRIVAVVAALFVVGGVLVVRASSSPAGTGDGRSDPTVQQPAAAGSSQSRSPGAVSGVPAGEGEEGAVVTSLELASAAQDWLYLSDGELEAQVRSVAAAASADRLVEEVIAEVGLARDALARSPGRVWWVVRPLAWRVDTFTPGRAQVSVWTVSVLSAADVAMPQSDWTTTVFDLEWDGDGWRLVSMSDTPGPTPQLGGRDEAWEPEPFEESLVGFMRVGADQEVRS